MGVWPRVNMGAWPGVNMGAVPRSTLGHIGARWGNIAASSISSIVLLWSSQESWDHTMLQPTAEICVSRVVHYVCKCV